MYINNNIKYLKHQIKNLYHLHILKDNIRVISLTMTTSIILKKKKMLPIFSQTKTLQSHTL